MSKKLGKFQQLKSVALRMIGKANFDTDAEGKVILTDDDKGKLKTAFSDDFLKQFENALDMSAELDEQQATAQAALDQLKADSNTEMQSMVEKVNAEKQRADDLASENVQLKAVRTTLQEAVDVLSAESEEDVPAETLRPSHGGAGSSLAIGAKSKDVWGRLEPAQKQQMAKMFHNQMASEYLQGNTGKAMGASSSSFGNSAIPGMAGNTINVDEVATEFGTYLSNANIRLEIIQKLTQKTESQMYMTTKQAITEWRATTAIITDVVQQFVAKWTPLGASKFSPLTIKNRHHKVNLPITPDDINDSWLSYLYDEQVTPDQMPVTRYILEKLLRPKIESNVELLMIATGVYAALGPVTEGQAGQATGKNMDGYVTILKAEKATGTSDMNFFTPSVALSDVTIVDVLEEYSDWIENEAPLYAKAGMNIFIDPTLYKKFKRKYRELYPTTKNEDVSKDTPDFSNLTFVPLNAMRGTGVFFSTPKENFIRLIHKNAAGGETKLFLQVENYTVKVFAEFWLGVGFAMAELVFAYVPEPAVSGA